MKPVNQKSLFHFLTDQMEKLDKKQVTAEEAKAQAGLSNQLNKMYNYELRRAQTEMEIREFNAKYGANVEIRNIEGKPFD